MYTIKQDFITENRSYTPLEAIGVTLHSTATPGATDENEQDYYDEKYREASAHIFLDWDSITQFVPFYEVTYHACEPANSLFLSVELCEPYSYDINKFNEVWKRAIWTFAYLFVNILKIYTVSKDNLMSHHEVSNKWHNTTHEDPTQYFATYGKTVDQFRNEVQIEINKMIKGDEEEMIKIYPGDSPDTGTAMLIARAVGGQLTYRADVKETDANNVVQIGGGPKTPIGKAIVGIDLLDTATRAIEWAKKYIKTGII
jgi:N-acetylmuramoyl-L-alanine amidase